MGEDHDTSQAGGAEILSLGPVLRGLSYGSAVKRTGDETELPAPDHLIPEIRAGALFHLEGAVDSSGKPGGSPEPGDTTLILSTVPSIGDPAALDELVRTWNAYQEVNGTDPKSVALPDGSRWVRDTEAGIQPVGATGNTAGGNGATPTPETTVPSQPPDSPLPAANRSGTLPGRVALVTGAAQGFGWELARGLAALGAVVALADMNLEGAREKAELLGAPHRAFAVNVSDEESVSALVDAVTAAFGGIDLLVSNAGVLRAGSVKELPLKDFRFVTDVNYVGFFLMTKHVSPVLEMQHRAAGALLTAEATAQTNTTGSSEAADTVVANAASTGTRFRPYLTDIIEINSKSGLEGSNKNGAYAGSKFGGIGLVQSFALELVAQGTKVNAICPGNFLDGPLWSDPDRGLFVQYLRTGKVPGAKTIADVRRFYEGKVPMKRGCTGTDVLRALVYTVGQEYETGQAVPVTGGQVMLS